MFSVMGGLSLLANLTIVHTIMQIALNFHRNSDHAHRTAGNDDFCLYHTVQPSKRVKLFKITFLG